MGRRHRSVKLAISIAATLALAVTACGSDAPPAADPPARPERAETVRSAGDGPPPVSGSSAIAPGDDVESLAGVKLRLTRVASFPDMITGIASHPGRPELLVAQRSGPVHRIELQNTGKSIHPELQDDLLVDLTGITSIEVERGVFSMRFDRSGDTLLISHSDSRGLTISGFDYSDKLEQLRLGDRWDVLQIDHPRSSHFGGGMAIDDNGDIWVGVGDQSEQYRDPTAQDQSTPLGGVVRIAHEDLERRETASRFAAGDILAKGLRNPFSVAIDTDDRTLWIGDVQDLTTEEVDVLDLEGSRANFGWPYLEADTPRTDVPAGLDLVPPVFTYPHTPATCAVMLGPVYRGAALPQLRGSLIQGDLCSGKIYAARLGPDQTFAERREIASVDDATFVAFGTGPWGELYAATTSGDLFRLDPPDWDAADVATVRPPETTTTINPDPVDPLACGMRQELIPLQDIYQQPLADRPRIFAGVRKAIADRVEHLPPEVRADGDAVLATLDSVGARWAAAGWATEIIRSISDDIEAGHGEFAKTLESMTRVVERLTGHCPP